MNTSFIKNNLTTIIAAAVIVAGTTAILSTYASQGEDNDFKQLKEDLQDAVASDDYEAWTAIISENEALQSLTENIDEETFDSLSEAYQLAESGDKEGAKELLDDLEIEPPLIQKLLSKGHGGFRPFLKLGADLTEEQKTQLKEALELLKDGDREGAQAIFDALGIPMPPERPEKWSKGNKFGLLSDEAREAVKAAIEAGDYDAFVAAIESENPDATILDGLTEEKFQKLVEMHEAKLSGDGKEFGRLNKGFRYPRRGFHHFSNSRNHR